MTPCGRPTNAGAAVAVLAATVTACAYTSSSPFASYPELPPAAQRSTVGLWDLGDRNCKGSIQTAGGSAYWVVDCRVKAGHGHCTHGLALVGRGTRYTTADGSITFTVGEDGGLEEAKDGRLYRRYSSTPGQICGAASSPKSGEQAQ